MKFLFDLKKLSQDLYNFIVNHGLFLVVEVVVTISSLIFCGFFADRIFFSIVFADNPEVRKVMIIEHFDGGMLNIALTATLVLVTLIFYLYLLIVEPILVRRRMTSDNFQELHKKLENRVGMNLIYLVFMIFMIKSCSIVAGNYGEMKDISGYLEDIRLYREGELPVTHGVLRIAPYAMNLENDTKISPRSGITYLSYLDDVYSKTVCLRCPPKFYEELNKEGAYAYEVTYMPYSKIVVKLEVYGRVQDNEANKLPGYETLTEQEKNLLRIMLDDRMGEICVNASGGDIILPYYFSGEKVYRDRLKTLTSLYETYRYEYGVMPYYYDMYGTDSGNNLLCCSDREHQYWNDNTLISFDQSQYYKLYQSRMDSIIQQMPRNMTDEEKVLYLTQYMIDHCIPIDNVEVSELYSFESKYFCKTGYGAILSGNGNSLAYSQALYGLLQRAGIESIPVMTEKRGYGLNMVKLDGEWYFLDSFAADYLSTNEAILFTGNQFEHLYNRTVEEFAPRYGYTDQAITEWAKTPIGVTLRLDGNQRISKEKLEEEKKQYSLETYEGICNVFTKNTPKEEMTYPRYSKHGIPLEGEDIPAELEQFVKYLFKHAQTYCEYNDQREDETISFSYGEESNYLARELFMYLCMDGLKEQDASVIAQNKAGYFGNSVCIGGEPLRECYRMLTGMELSEEMATNANYELPDLTAVYMYDVDWDVFMQVRKSGFVDRSGSVDYPGNVGHGLNKFPLRVEVEQIVQEGDIYHIVFYTTYTDYGDYYFNMDVRVDENKDMTILLIQRRY